MSEKFSTSCECASRMQALLEENRKMTNLINSQAKVIDDMRGEFYSLISSLEKKIAANEANRPLSSGLVTKQNKIVSIKDSDIQVFGDTSQTDREMSQSSAAYDNTEHRSDRVDGGSTERNKAHDEMTESASSAVKSVRMQMKVEVKSKARQNKSAPKQETINANILNVNSSITAGGSNEDNDDYKVVTYRRNNNKSRAFVGNKVSSAVLAGVEGRIWLFVGRTRPGTTVDAVLDYLKSEIPNGEFICESINTTGPNPCFKVGAPMALKDRLECSDFWPRGILVRRFNFRIGRNFLDRAKTREIAT